MHCKAEKREKKKTSMNFNLLDFVLIIQLILQCTKYMLEVVNSIYRMLKLCIAYISNKQLLYISNSIGIHISNIIQYEWKWGDEPRDLECYIAFMPQLHYQLTKF